MYKLFLINGFNTEILMSATDIYKTFPEGLSTQNVLVSESGWDDVNNVEIETVPKLNGGGSYIVSERIGEKEFSVEINIPSSFETVYSNLKKDLLNFNTIGCAYYIFNDNGTQISGEILNGGRITSLKKTQAKINQGWGTVLINMKFSTNPTAVIV